MASATFHSTFSFQIEYPDKDPGLIVYREFNEISRPFKNIDVFAPVCK